VLLICRGHCGPYYRQQLLAFQKKLASLQALNVAVIAASVDPLEEVRQTRERYSLAFRIGYGLDVREIAKKTGAFFEGQKGLLHSADFVIDPEGKVVIAVYNSGDIGRLVPDDCLGLIRYHKENG
jgi:peroxiredoxin